MSRIASPVQHGAKLNWTCRDDIYVKGYYSNAKKQQHFNVGDGEGLCLPSVTGSQDVAPHVACIFGTSVLSAFDLSTGEGVFPGHEARTVLDLQENRT